MQACMMKFSVCMSVYKNDNATDVQTALDSVLQQSVAPSEVIVVIDGVISEELARLLSKYEDENKIRTILIPKNRGLGNALNVAVSAAQYELIARMDSDDICLPSRFEKQLECFAQDDSLSIVGGSISEFIDTPDNIVAKRECPQTHSDIYRFMKVRCGFNHMKVMFKKTEVLRAGNYQDYFWNEDYYLWIRMMLCGCKFCNIKDVLVNVRVGKEMYARRGGWKYFHSEYALQCFMFEKHIIGVIRFIMNVVIRFLVQIMLPDNIRGFMFQKMFRKSLK